MVSSSGLTNVVNALLEGAMDALVAYGRGEPIEHVIPYLLTRYTQNAAENDCDRVLVSNLRGPPDS